MHTELNSKRIVFYVISLFAGLFLIAIVLEIILHSIKFNPYGMHLRYIEAYSRGEFIRCGYWGTIRLKQPSPYKETKKAGEYIPNLDFRFVYASNPRKYFDDGNSVSYHTNSLGLRGPEISLKKTRGVFRIIGLGDSYTFGEGVKYDDTFLCQIQKSLIENGGTRNFEVINCGVSGYNTSDEVTYLENRWIKLEPDLILLNFVVNDGYNDADFGLLYQGYLEGASLIPGSNNEKPASLIYAFIKNLYLRNKLAHITKNVYLSQFSNNPVLKGYTWDNCKEMFLKAETISKKINGKMALVIFPELYQLNKNYPFKMIHDQIKNEAGKLGIPCLDLFPAFYNMDAKKLWVHPTDHHPNEIAHAIIAKEILQFINDANLIDFADYQK